MLILASYNISHNSSVIQSGTSDWNVLLSFHCFENPTVLHAVQLWFGDQNIPLSFHCFENLIALHAIQSLIILTYVSIFPKDQGV
jgi:hypothetical protein